MVFILRLFETLNQGNVYIIAEMSANHAGKLKNALAIVRAAKKTGADCLKIQTYTPDTMTIPCNNEYFQIKGGLWNGKTLYDLYNQAYTPWEWHKAIKEECDKVGLDFLSTPFDKSAVDFLEEIGVDFYKIASFEIVDIPLIQYVASKGKPIILSCGLASCQEIDDAIQAAYSTGNHNIILLKCCSEYPTVYSDMKLATIVDMKERFHLPIGLSDHSMGSLAATVAVSLGACVVEKHFCTTRNCKTPDSKFSMEPNELKQMVKDIRLVKDVIGKCSYELTEKEKASTIFRRSIFAVDDIAVGMPFTSQNARIIRPGYGMKPKYYPDLLKLNANQVIKKGSPITFDMVESGVILFLTNNDISFEVYKWLKKSEKVILYNDKLTLDVILAIQPSYIISYNYKYIITNDIIQFMQNKIINMHISLLPYNKGASPNFFSFYDNTPKGVTIHLIDDGIDTGDILCQKEVYFNEEDETWESSYLKLHQQIQQLFYEKWGSIKNSNIMPSKQYNKGTFHTKAELKELKQRFPFSWNETIAEYKKKYNIGGL